MRLPRRAHASLALLIAGIGTSSTLLLVRDVPARAHLAAPAFAPHHAVPDEAVARAWEERTARAERQEARATRGAPTTDATTEELPAPRPLAFLWPADGQITGPFGERRGRERHPGIDIDGEVGDPVRVAAAGLVVWAGPAPAGYEGYGNVVIIDVGSGIVTLYAHLSAWTVAVAHQVAAGDHLGSIGTSGHVTGSHLHFEVRAAGAAVDPAIYLPTRPDQEMTAPRDDLSS